jgi:hypothetical protein
VGALTAGAFLQNKANFALPRKQAAGKLDFKPQMHADEHR